jgi:uncharacterized oxidoreductase
MKTQGNTVLITGGATGIGFSLAEAFVKAGNEVVICGRREAKLREAKSKLPQVHVTVCDLSKEAKRKFLYEWVVSNFNDVNILVNNAGIQRMIDLKEGVSELSAGEDEIEVNLKACIHLSALFTPWFLQKEEAAIINVSSGLGFVPIAIMPVYCATKAAVHSFTQSLRHQLRDTSVKVFEVIPPTVDTELDKGARAQRGQEDRGIPPVEVAKATMKALESNQYEVPVGMAENLRTGARTNPEQLFQNMNSW